MEFEVMLASMVEDAGYREIAGVARVEVFSSYNGLSPMLFIFAKDEGGRLEMLPLGELTFSIEDKAGAELLSDDLWVDLTQESIAGRFGVEVWGDIESAFYVGEETAQTDRGATLIIKRPNTCTCRCHVQGDEKKHFSDCCKLSSEKYVVEDEQEERHVMWGTLLKLAQERRANLLAQYGPKQIWR